MSGYRLILVSKVLLRLIGKAFEEWEPVTRDARNSSSRPGEDQGGLGYLGDEVGAARFRASSRRSGLSGNTTALRCIE